MPLAEAARAIALSLEHLGDGEVLGLEDRSAKGTHDAVKPAPVVLPGQEGESAGCADTRRAVTIGEGHSLGNISDSHVISI